MLPSEINAAMRKCAALMKIYKVPMLTQKARFGGRFVAGSSTVRSQPFSCGVMDSELIVEAAGFLDPSLFYLFPKLGDMTLTDRNAKGCF